MRDLAQGRTPADLDVAIDGSAPLFARRVAHALGVRGKAAVELKFEPRFGTASLILAGDGGAGSRLDLAQLRSEHYPRPGALPAVRLGATLEADLARRDVSVNAIALGLAGTQRGRVIDPFDGLRDLEAGRLHVLHAHSFRDDATRLWRNARTVVSASLMPDERSREWIVEGARWLERISGDRLWAEFELVSQHRSAAAVVALLDDWGVLKGTHRSWRLAVESLEALRRLDGTLGVNLAVAPAEALAAVLLAPLSRRRAILERLRAPPSAREAVEGARALLRTVDSATDPLAGLERTSPAARVAASLLGGATQRELQRELRRWERTRPQLDAAALLRLGVAEGPAVGGWLRRLRRARYDGTLGDAAAARRLVRRELEEMS